MKTALHVLASAASLAVLSATALAQPDAGPDAVRYDGDQIVRVQIDGPADRAKMRNLGAQEWECRPALRGAVDFHVPKAGVARLAETGLAMEVLIADLQAVADEEAARIRASRQEGGGAGGAWFGDYKDYATISAYVDQLAAAFPNVVTRISLGTSLEGREIFGMRIAAPGAPADRTGLIVHGLQHAREWVTGMSTMYLADRLARCAGSDAEVDAVLASVQFYIVPVVNPDGYSYTWTNQRFWRKNRRQNNATTFGVDLNRNWGFEWGGLGASQNTGSDTYRGPAAFSEPETRALRDFIVARPHIRAHLDVHSYSQLILSPWGYTNALPQDHWLFADLNEVMRAAFAGRHGLPYVAGPTYTTIYPASGVAADWSYGALGVLGWGFELRDRGQFGFALPANQIIPAAEETYAGILALARAIGEPIRFTFPDGVPAVVGAGVTRDVRVVVTGLAGQVAPGSPRMLVRVGRFAGFQSVALVPVSGTEFVATLPAAPCGAEIHFAFDAMTVGGLAVTSPGAPYVALTGEGSPLAACIPCAADLGRDGLLDPDDLSDFITAFFAGDAIAEFNGDGNLDPDDLADYITAFFAGC